MKEHCEDCAVPEDKSKNLKTVKAKKGTRKIR